MQSLIYFLKNLLPKIFLALFLILIPAHYSFSENSNQISHKLWRGITESDLDLLKKVVVNINLQDYDQALRYANQMKENHKKETDQSKISLSNALINIILWNKFSDIDKIKSFSFSDISRFAIDNSFYPNINDIRKNVEKIAAANNVPYGVSSYYFSLNPASTLESKLYFLQSKIDALSRLQADESEKEKERENIRALISDLWIKENFSKTEEENFLKKYQNQLNEIDHVNRINRLLWDNEYGDIDRIINLVDKDYSILVKAISEIKNSNRHVENIINEIPRRLRSNENLNYHRIMWYKSRDMVDELVDVLLEVHATSQFPEKWWNIRRLYSREMLKQKKYKIAYKIASAHNLPVKSSDFWEAEWLTGWIALRFLDKPDIAYFHFDRLYKNVSQPVTLSRSAYWLGMAEEANKNKEKAVEWYKVGAKYPTFFYGQLSIHKHRNLDYKGSKSDIILPKDPEISNRDLLKSSESIALQVAYLLEIIGDKKNASKIFEWAVNNATSDGQIAVIMKVINEIGDRQLDAKISRIAAKRNVFFIKDKFQIIKEVANDEYAPLVHAIIKQESGFVPSALSKVGAIGFMQLMPDTAKLVAKEMGIAYNKKKLATDISYNIKLGSFYIKKLIDQFDGSEMLAIASYNAGPNATQRWINEFFDPRKEKDLDRVVDWIELITYSETRNYVQRITENLIVYKYLMSRSNYDSVK